MKRTALQQLRNIGITAHIDAGKTTLTERILFLTGKTHRLGETHLGNSQMDTSKMEIDKGITISSAATQTHWNYLNEEHTLNIIDTPGHVDFMIEVERSLRVLDGMVLLFDAVAGVEPQSETIWVQAQRNGIPAIAMVNKMDRIGADFFNVVQEMRDQLGTNALAIQLPVGEEETFQGVIDLIGMKMIVWSSDGSRKEEKEIPSSLVKEAEQYRMVLLEELAVIDEALMLQFLEDASQIAEHQIHEVLRKAVLSREVVPVLLGAAYKNKGVETLLDAICAYLPNPIDRGSIEGLSIDDESGLLRNPTTEDPFSSLVFKIALDEQNRELTFFRVYSGSLSVGDTIWNPRTKVKERIGRLYLMHANKRTEITTVKAGGIAATVGLKSIRTGDTCS